MTRDRQLLPLIVLPGAFGRRMRALALVGATHLTIDMFLL
jgi:hypothetical protein